MTCPEGEMCKGDTPTYYATVASITPGTSIDVHYDTTIEKVVCTQHVMMPPGPSHDVVFGWASVLVMGSFLYAYMVTRQKRRRP